MAKKQGSTPLVSDRLSYLWLVIAAVMLVFTYGMYRNLLAAGLAYIFLLRFMRSRKVGVGYLLAMAALIVANTISWWNMDTSLPPVGRMIFGLIVGAIYSNPPAARPSAGAPVPRLRHYDGFSCPRHRLRISRYVA